MLASLHPGFAYYSVKKSDVELSAPLMFIQNGAPLKLADRIEDTDCISILLPVTEG